MPAKQYTPYDDVNAIMDILLDNGKGILGKQFIGMYIFGSLANGDFDDASDIDVLVVTRNAIAEAEFSALGAMHKRIATLDSPWATELEVSYIPQDAVRRFDPANKLHPRLDRGQGEILHMMEHETDWIIQRHILYEHGITLEGPAPQTLIEPVSQNDLRQAVIDVLPLWVTPIVENPSQHLKHRGYQSFIVLSLCRMLYTIQRGAVASKSDAAEWAKTTLGNEWSLLIERAIKGRQNGDLEAQPEDVKGTLEFIRYTRDCVSQYKKTTTQPTKYPEVNEVLNLLLSNAKEILGNRFFGMYLYGSLSSGDFNPKSSDIDFVIVTTELLADGTISRLEAMHNHIWASGAKWAAKLEGSYMPKDHFRRDEPAGQPCPTVNEGKFSIHRRGPDWVIQLHIIREHGVILEGPEPKSFIDPVSPEEICQAVTDTLNERWFPILDDPAWLMERGSEHHAFTVITMCRALYALRYGTIVSKPVAAKWAQDEFGEPWNSLIEKALLSQTDTHVRFPNEALDFIQFARDQLLDQK